jgi:hypothetical protein
VLRVVFLRHSEPDYSFAEERRHIGHGLDLARLTENGIRLGESVSKLFEV